MALALSFSTPSHSLKLGGLPLSSSKPSLPLKSSLHLFQPTPSLKSSIHPLLSTTRSRIPHRRLYALEKSNDEPLSGDQSQPQPPIQAQAQAPSEEKEKEKEPASLTEVASELKQMLREKKEREEQGDSFFIGVAQEVKQIEWPDLGKVVGTTGVVLAVIAGSTAALLSVNAILAELSDKVFAGKGIQDFF